MGSLVIILELGLVALLLLLAFRVLSLNRSEPLVSAMPSEAPVHRDSWSHSSTLPSKTKSAMKTNARPELSSQHPDKCELISQLHILASLQMRDCREQGLDVERAHLAVREYTVCWLYGAACALSSPGKRDVEVLSGLVCQFASRKAGIRQSEAVTVISTLTRQSAFLACFRSGIEGAEFWKNHHFVMREQSLFEAATSNAFI